MNIKLECFSQPEGEDQGFYVLRGGDNWASVEGHASEWLAIASFLLGKTAGKTIYFKRCASVKREKVFEFWSPRNASSDRDYVSILTEEAKELADQIIKVLMENGEKIVLEVVKDW